MRFKERFTSMLVLAIDTAMAVCSVALCRDAEVLGQQTREMNRGQSEALMPMIEQVMSAAGESMKALDLIAVTRGPGAFTGLRIGLAAARGLSLALGIPCLGVITTEVIAVAERHDGPQGKKASCLLVVLDTKRKDLYVQAFCSGADTAKLPRALAVEDIPDYLHQCGCDNTKIRVAGDAAETACSFLVSQGMDAELSAQDKFPDTAHMARTAAGQWQKDKGAKTPEPLYLRPPDATIPKNGGRLRP